MPKGYGWAAAPLEGTDGPCGPDLEAADDAAFVDWYCGALGRLPERYILRGAAAGAADRAFDLRSVDIRAEKAAAEGLLARSRDLCVLALMARWEMLTGRGPAAAEAVATIADLLEAHPAAVHPTDPVDRRAALADLADRVTAIEPLLHPNLAGPGRRRCRCARCGSRRGRRPHCPTRRDTRRGAMHPCCARS